jgi:hypothetical protein
VTIAIPAVTTNQTFGTWLNRTNDLLTIISSNTVTVDSTTSGSISTGNGYVNGYFGASTLLANSTLSISNGAVIGNSSGLFLTGSISIGGNVYVTGNFSTVGNNVVNGNYNPANSSFSLGNTANRWTLYAVSINVTNDSIFTSNVTVNSSIIVGNSTTNAVVNSSAFTLSNSTVSMSIRKPTAAQYSNGQFFLNANGSWTSVSIVNQTTNGSVTTTGTSTQTIDSFALSAFQGAEYIVSASDNTANNKYVSKILCAHNGSSSFTTEYGQITTNGSIGVFGSSTNATHFILNFTPSTSNCTVRYTRTVV